MSSLPEKLGKYRIQEVLGRGGMGEVVKAWQPDLNRPVAIKTLLAGEQATEGFLERFQREARLAAHLRHPGIVQIHDFGTEGRLHYIVMEYVEGKSLKEILAERGKLEPEAALRIAYAVARTLQFAHDRQIVHRDVKPANLVIDRQNRVRILDFGLAKSLSDEKAITLSATMLGTPAYMSPEQAFGAPEEVDARADVYSLGAVLYEMLVGRPPFEGGTVLAVLRKIEDEDPAPPGVSPAVDAAVLKALAKDRERRFASAADFADALKACVAGVSLEPPPPTVRAESAPRPHAAWPLVAGVAAAAALAGAGLVVLGRGRPSEPPPAPAPAPPTPEAGLRALLSRKLPPSAAELDPYRDDPALARVVARHFQDRGQFSRALDFLKGYDRAVGELMSARALQRFVSPALFRLSIAQPRDVAGAESFWVAALARHLEGKNDAARLKLKSAASGGAPPGQVLLLRAHLELCEVFPDPEGEAQRQVLAALREELDASDELFLLPLRAIAAQLAGDPGAAREAADRFARLAPLSAEDFVLQSILLQRGRQFELASEQAEDAGAMDPRHFDVAIHLAYLRVVEHLRDPSGGPLERAAILAALDERLKIDHYPAALLLRAVLRVFDGDWEGPAEDLKRLARRAPVDRVVVDHPILKPFVWATESRSRLLVAGRDLLWHVGRRDSARAAAREVTGLDLPDEDRIGLLLENRIWLARASLHDEEAALEHLEEALRLGAAPAELRDDGRLAALRPRPAFRALLRRHRDAHVRMAKRVLEDEDAALAQLEEALRFGTAPGELRSDGELGELRERPAFAELMRRYGD